MRPPRRAATADPPIATVGITLPWPEARDVNYCIACTGGSRAHHTSYTQSINQYYTTSDFVIFLDLL